MQLLLKGLKHLWQQDRLSIGCLAPLSALYGAIVRIRNWAYDRGLCPVYSLPGYTISIGNLVVGGTGKTPVVMALAQSLWAEGHRPVILTRGYGVKGLSSTGWIVLLAGKVLHAQGWQPHHPLPDEAHLTSYTLPQVPVVLSPNRWEAARGYLDLGVSAPTHWILEDGFQHRRVKRQEDWVLLDYHRPFGNGHLLPQGSLREPPQGALSKRAHKLLVTRSPHLLPIAPVPLLRPWGDIPTEYISFHTTWPHTHHTHTPWQADVHTPPLIACGIAQPDSFLEALQAHHIPIHNQILAADHESFTLFTLESHIQTRSARSVIITAKDYFRHPDLWQQLSVPVFIARLELKYGLPANPQDV